MVFFRHLTKTANPTPLTLRTVIKDGRKERDNDKKPSLNFVFRAIWSNFAILNFQRKNQTVYGYER